MALTTRRQFAKQTALTTAALYRRSVRPFAQDITEPRAQSPAPVDAASIRSLVSGINGQVITPETAEYESARLVFNRAFYRRPAVIVRCAGAPDVVRALAFAQTRNLPAAVRAGGHSRLGYGMCDGGLVIDLSGMRRVQVDASKRVARAEAGALVRDLDEATQRFGLATTFRRLPDARNCRSDARWRRRSLNGEVWCRL